MLNLSSNAFCPDNHEWKFPEEEKTIQAINTENADLVFLLEPAGTDFDGDYVGPKYLLKKKDVWVRHCKTVTEYRKSYNRFINPVEAMKILNELQERCNTFLKEFKKLNV